MPKQGLYYTSCDCSHPHKADMYVNEAAKHLDSAGVLRCLMTHVLIRKGSKLEVECTLNNARNRNLWHSSCKHQPKVVIRPGSGYQTEKQDLCNIFRCDSRRFGVLEPVITPVCSCKTFLPADISILSYQYRRS